MRGRHEVENKPAFQHEEQLCHDSVAAPFLAAPSWNAIDARDELDDNQEMPMTATNRTTSNTIGRLITLVAAASVLLATIASAEPVQTASGLVEGLEADGVRSFKGIPFAAPPIGALRWRAPAPPASWAGVRNADQFSPICMQPGAYPDDAPPEPMSEDCLYLNIWAPADAQEAPLPVMVWIYGGGLLNGGGSTPLYAGDALARRGVIVVTFNYRLGAFGFLAHPELTQETDYRASGNYGLLDQIAALNWVQRNIAAFGGDPDNVTVFGQSSGAISISALVTSPRARGLFHRAIAQSGGLLEPLDAAPEFGLEGAEQVGVALASRLGAPSVDALRALPASTIVEQPFNPQPIVDRYVLHENPFEALASGRAKEVDLLVGSNAEEGLYFLSGREVTAANLGDRLREDFPAFIVSLIGPRAPDDDTDAREAFISFESDMRFGWNMWAWARLHAAAGRRNTFYYRFAHAPAGQQGATHGAEMAYVFDHLDVYDAPWAESDRRLAETMVSYWTNFARTGDPNGEGLPNWPVFGSSNQRIMLIEGDGAQAAIVPNEANLAAIDRLYATVRVLLKYGVFLAAAVGLIALALLWWVVALVLRRRKPSQ